MKDEDELIKLDIQKQERIRVNLARYSLMVIYVFIGSPFIFGLPTDISTSVMSIVPVVFLTVIPLLGLITRQKWYIAYIYFGAAFVFIGMITMWPLMAASPNVSLLEIILIVTGTLSIVAVTVYLSIYVKRKGVFEVPQIMSGRMIFWIVFLSVSILGVLNIISST